MIALQPTQNSEKEPRQGALLFPRAPGFTLRSPSRGSLTTVWSVPLDQGN